MEAEELTVGRVHHGHNIRRFRIEKNMNQEVLSQLVHLSQSAVSKYEQMRVMMKCYTAFHGHWESLSSI